MSNKQNKREKDPFCQFCQSEPFYQENNYNEAHMDFKSKQYIPSNSIPIIMNHYFNSSKKILHYNDDHFVYQIMLKDLLNDSIENWEYNRPPDMGRIDDIATYIYKSKCPFETMIYLSFNKQNEKFDILDGIHRITALKFIKEENSKPLDLVCPNKFGTGNDATWLFNQYVLVNIRFNSSMGNLIDLFENLNKSRAVPELYMGNHQAKNKVKIINNMANDWYHKYKKHFSSSSKPNTGNTNRDKFVDLLDKLYDKYECKDENKLRDILDKANTDLSLNNPKVSIDALYKCKETGCYLFLLKNDKLLEHIDKLENFILKKEGVIYSY